MMVRLRERQEWQLAAALWGADRGLAAAWWALVVAAGVAPAVFAVATGFLVDAVEDGRSLTAPLVVVGVVFVGLQVLTPLHEAVGANLGSRTSGWLHERLMRACIDPPGIAHLERPSLTNDLTMARDFDLGITGPPLAVAVGFIAGGLVQLVGGLAAAAVLFGFTWWAPPLLVAAWAATHWLLRESAVWRDRNTEPVRDAQRHADYAYRLAVDPPAAKEVRLFGLEGWVVDRFADRRRRLLDLQWEATRLRERPVVTALLLVVAANVAVFWALADAALDGRVGLGGVVVFAQTAFGVSALAFGGWSWALDGTAAPAAAVRRLGAAMAPVGALARPAHAASRRLAEGNTGDGRAPAPAIRFRDVTFAYPTTDEPVLDGFDLDVPAGTSLAIVGRNGAGKTTLAKLLCRLYDPTSGAIEVDGVDLRDLDVDAWRSRVTAVFQDFVRYEVTLAENVAPLGAPDEELVAALVDAGLAGWTGRTGTDGRPGLETILARGYRGGIDLSGGQWQRVALARALCAVRLGAGLVLLDEPTAQLDVRGEAEIFRRVLAATRSCTTILVSHRFSTVRHADRICVVEDGRVVELGSHDELMVVGGRYRTMFDLQASRFADPAAVGDAPAGVAPDGGGLTLEPAIDRTGEPIR